MSDQHESRRAFLARLAAAGLAVSGASLLSACGGGDDTPQSAAACAGYDQLTQPELAMRQGLNYVDNSPNPAQLCSNCLHYQAPTEGVCGGCALVPGPVLADGYCTAWVAQA